ncbi:MAG: carboxypeptidase-like regulatory domain-containing protein [Acidobacteriota bacterium]
MEGRVVDSKTKAGLPGISVDFDGECRHGAEVATALTDEQGHYTIELEPGRCNLWARAGLADASPRPVEIRRGGVAVIDVELDHDAVVAAQRDQPPSRCPRSAPDAVVKGHTTTQQDTDDVARAVLERFTADEGTLPDGGLLPAGVIFVRAEVAGRPHRRLTVAALPAGTKRRFMLMTTADLQTQADRSGREVYYIDLGDLDSDGNCALLSAGANFVMPSAKRAIKMCCCAGYDVYEKSQGRWLFVRRDSESCI